MQNLTYYSYYAKIFIPFFWDTICLAMRFASLSLAVVVSVLAIADSFAEEGVAADGRPPSSVASVVNEEIAAPASVAEVMASTIARFPVEPITLTGSLIVRRQGGMLVREVPFSIALNWGAEPASATYTLMDNFGRPQNVLRVTRSSGGLLEISYFDGSGSRLPNPALTAQIAGTDITWLDITLSFLWWNDGKLLEPDKFKGTLCDVVEVYPPQPIEGCKAMRLWIDRKRGFMRQAEQIDASGKRVRWMWVESVGKINDRWMIRNLEVKRPGTGVQTKLHVDDLETP